MLDPLYFGAGNSFHESMYYGTPTVTLPTQNLKSRIVLGAYKQMQIENPPISTELMPMALATRDMMMRTIATTKAPLNRSSEDSMVVRTNGGS